MSPTKPPGRGPKSSADTGGEAKNNPWASYDDADDWSITGDRPQGRADPTSQLKVAAKKVTTPGQAVAEPVLLRVVHAGESTGAGEVFHVTHSPFSLGRAKDNDIVLADASISRNHATLELRQGTWHIVDQNSGNGVFLRGKRVPMGPLALGDTLALGQVHLRLELGQKQAGQNPPRKRPGDAIDVPSEVSAVMAPAPRAGSAKSPPGPANVAAAGLSWLRGARRWVAPSGARWHRPVAAIGVAALVASVVFARMYLREARASAQSFALCSQGIEAFGAQKWDDAEQAFADALAIRPHHALTKTYQSALLVARRDAALLADAQQRRERGDFERARAALASLAGTTFVGAAWLEASRYGSAITQVAMQAETALGAGLIAEARALLESLGKNPPARADLTALTTWSALRSANSALEEVARLQSQRQKPTPSLWEQAQTQSRAMRSAIGVFRVGSAVTGPAAALNRLGSPRTAAETALLVALKRFTSLYDTALVEHRGKRAFAAIKLLGEARMEAVKVAGEGSRPARDVEAKMADMYYVLGVQGLMAGHLAEASEALHTAVRLRPGHGLSLRRLDELNERAERMVDEAEFLGAGHASKAQDMLRQVLEAMPANAPVTARARALSKAIGGKS